MIQVTGLKKSYGGVLIIDRSSFILNKGERIGLVGRNGSGKSTLLRLITSHETPDEGAIQLPKNYLLGFLKQHIHFTHATVLDEAASALPPQEREALYKVEKILFGLGFNDEDMQKTPNSLSGGYQLRLHLTKVLAEEPDCLLLDEPTNYLDILSIRWLERFLKSWRKEMILISHDRGFMDSVTTHTLGIHRKKIRKVAGATVNYFTQVLQEEEIQERTREKMETKKEHLEKFINRFGAKASKAKQAQSKAKAIQRMPVLEKLAHLEHLDFTFHTHPFSAERMATLNEVSFSYSDNLSLIQNFSLEIHNKDRIAIIGKNGRGKSTLLNLMGGILMPKNGGIRISENARIGFFGQTNIDRLDSNSTVEEEISCANRTLSTTEIRSICGEMLFSGDLAKKPIRVLSGGERSRVLLGKIIATPCNLLLLDEPTHHLDMESIEAMVDALDQFTGAALIVTHSELLLREIPFTKLIICKENEQSVFQGSYDEFLEKMGWEDEEREKASKKASRQDTRQQNAIKVQERSKKMKSYKEKADALEKEIMQLDKEIEKENVELMEAYRLKMQATTIAELSRSIKSKKLKVDELFIELEKTNEMMRESLPHPDEL